MPKILLLAPNAEDFARELTQRMPDLDLATAKNLDEALPQAEGVEVMITLGASLKAELFQAMPRLKWIQALSAGTDHIQRAPGLPEDVALTSLSGAHGPQMSELAILMMLALPRRFRKVLAHQDQRKWTRHDVPTLVDKRLCILGLGAIAEALTARALPFGMTVTGVSDGRKDMDGVEQVYPYARLAEAAADADFLCVLAPLTERSRGVVDAEVLKALGPDGYLISMGRGPVVDEAALTRALSDGTIAGAGLDVFDKEPLPETSPLWGMENVIVTPHIGGLSDRYAAQAAPIIQRNLEAWDQGGADALTNRVR